MQKILLLSALALCAYGLESPNDCFSTETNGVDSVEEGSGSGYDNSDTVTLTASASCYHWFNGDWLISLGENTSEEDLTAILYAYTTVDIDDCENFPST